MAARCGNGTTNQASIDVKQDDTLDAMRGGRFAGLFGWGLVGMFAFMPIWVAASLTCGPVVSWLDPGLNNTENGVEGHAIVLGLALTVMGYATCWILALARTSGAGRLSHPASTRRRLHVAIVVLVGLGFLTVASAVI